MERRGPFLESPKVALSTGVRCSVKRRGHLTRAEGQELRLGLLRVGQQLG